MNDDQDIDAVLAKIRGAAPTGHAGKPFVDAPEYLHRNDPIVEDKPGIGTKALGVLAALNRDIPGAELAQAGIRSLVRGQSYSQARDDIRGAEDVAPLAATLPARLAGAGLSTAAGGKAFSLGAKGAAALYGGLSGLGDSEKQSPDSRVTKGIIGATVGGLAGAAGAKAASIGKRIATPIVRAGRSAMNDAANAVTSLPKAFEGSLYPPEVMRAGTFVAKQEPVSLESLLAKARAEQPHELGTTWGDAEEAMGLAPHQQPDLAAQLRESLKLPKRTPTTGMARGTP